MEPKTEDQRIINLLLLHFFNIPFFVSPPKPPIFTIPELINCWRSILTLLIILIYIF